MPTLRPEKVLTDSSFDFIRLFVCAILIGIFFTAAVSADEVGTKSLESPVPSVMSQGSDGNADSNHFKKFKIFENDTLAKKNLRELSMAAETYATANEGRYPESPDVLVEAQPPYLDEDYCNRQISGFYYTCQMNVEGYIFTATPTIPGETGSGEFKMTTGGFPEPLDKSNSYTGENSGNSFDLRK